MKHSAALATIFAFLSFAPLPAANEGSQKPIQLPDILAWKRIASPQLSSDGAWFAYRLSPSEGDSDVIVRNLKDGKQQKFGIGELPAAGAAGPPPGLAGLFPARDLAISDDGKWVAFLAYPTAKEAKAMKRTRRPIQSRLVLVELATAKKTEFEKIRRFSFSGERSSKLAMLRYAPTPAGPSGAPAGGATPPPATPAPAATPGATPPEDRPTGADMLLVDLASSIEPSELSALNFGNVADFSFDKKGNWLAWLIDATHEAGKCIQVMNLGAGTILPLDSSKAVYRGLSWTEKGDALATLRGVDNKAWEDKLYSLVAFRGFSGSGAPDKIIFDPAKDSSFPTGMSIASARTPAWNAELTAITFGIHELKPKKTPPGRANTPANAAENTDATDSPAATPPLPPRDEPAKPDMVIWHWKDSRLQSMQQVQETADKNFSFLSVYRPAEKKFIRLGDEKLRQVNAGPESKFAIGFDVRDYELDSNLGGQRFEDVYSVHLQTGERKLALKKAQWVNAPSPDASHVLYYNDGAFFTYEIATGKSYNITKGVPAVFYDTEDDHNVIKPPTRPVGWSKDSSFILISDNWDIWKLPVHGGTGINLTANGKKDQIRYRTRYRLDPDEKGIDLSQPMYVSVYGEWTKKDGIGRIEPNKAGVKMLQWDDASFGGLMKAKRADVCAYTRETTQEYPNYRIAGPSLELTPPITDANPQQKNFLWSKGVKIINYTSAKGDKLQGALYLPANYEPGKSYPTIVYIYEKLSTNANTDSHPSFD